MPTVADLTARLGLNSDAFNQGVKNAHKQSTWLSRELKGMKMEVNASGLKDLGNLLRGGLIGGAFIAAANMANKALAGVNEQLIAVAKGERTVSDATFEMTASFIKAIPIAGQFFEVGEKLSDFFTLAGGGKTIDMLRAEIQQTTKAVKEQRGEVRKLNEERAKLVKQLETEAATMASETKGTERAGEVSEAERSGVPLAGEYKTLKHRQEDIDKEYTDKRTKYETMISEDARKKREDQEARSRETRHAAEQDLERRIAVLGGVRGPQETSRQKDWRLSAEKRLKDELKALRATPVAFAAGGPEDEKIRAAREAMEQAGILKQAQDKAIADAKMSLDQRVAQAGLDEMIKASQAGFDEDVKLAEQRKQLNKEVLLGQRAQFEAQTQGALDFLDEAAAHVGKMAAEGPEDRLAASREFGVIGTARMSLAALGMAGRDDSQQKTAKNTAKTSDLLERWLPQLGAIGVLP